MKKKKKEKQNTHKTETDNGTRKKIELSRKVDKSTTISFAHLFFLREVSYPLYLQIFG